MNNKNPKARQSVAKRLKKYLPLYLLALPSMIYLIINNYLPMVGLVLAFKKFSFAKGIFKSPWNGLGNFSYLFGSKWQESCFAIPFCTMLYSWCSAPCSRLRLRFC